MKWLIFWAVLILCTSYAHAKSDYDLDIVKLSEVSLDYAWVKDDTRDPILYPLVPQNQLDTRINMSILRYGFFENKIHSETAGNQFKLVGWNYRLGINIGDIQVYAEHFSQHILDGQGAYMPYPVYNAVGVRWFIYKDGN